MIYNIKQLNLEVAKIDAITNTEGPLLIIAGPGSGKTMTLVERIVYLIAKKGVQAENILVSTFTQKAARELVTRVSNRMLELNLRVNLHAMYFGTLHSIFLRFLEENREFTRLTKNYRMMDQFDQRYFLYRNLAEFEKIEGSEQILGDDKTSRWGKSANLLKQVSKVSEEVLNVDELIHSDYSNAKALGKMFQIYQRLLEEENCLDFSAIQLEALKLIENNPGVLEKIRNQIKYIMVDEYQDTNTIQERILLTITDPNHQNICVVGDDDQGLYRFRGATIRNILEFPQNFPTGQCKQVRLTTNYRSHPDIIRFCDTWIHQQNWTHGGKIFRYQKDIKPRDTDFVDNLSVIKVSSRGTEKDWHDEVFNFLKELREKSILDNYNQVAFLFKSVKNPKVIALANYLEQKGINIFSPRSALFFERKEVKLMLGALIFIFPNLFELLKWNDDAQLKIWDYYQECKRLFADEIRSNTALHENLLIWCRQKARKHLPLIRNTDYAFAVLFYQLLQFPMFSRYLDADLNDAAINLRAIYNLALFSSILTKFEYLANITIFTPKIFERILRHFFNQYLRFLYDGGIEEYEDFDEYAPSGCVSFMTIHQAKGLEFPIVFVDSLNSVPRKQFDDLDVLLQNEFYQKPPFEPIEETKYYDFWRLYYTAFSRAQNLLVLTGNEKNGRGLSKLPSKYFEFIYEDLISWRDPRFDIAKLNLDKIKSINLKKEYSFTSDILLYENCPLQYKFYKELEFAQVRIGATLFGSLVHQTIEDIHKAVLRGEEHKVTNENVEIWFNRNYNSLSKSLKTYLSDTIQKAALRQVFRYKMHQERDWSVIKQAEVDVSLVKDDYILKGTIDLIRGKNDTVEIIDFKSEKHKPDVNYPEDRIILNRYRRQLEIYAHLVEERAHLKVSRMHLFYTGEESGSPYITYDRSIMNLENTLKAFDKVVGLIENKRYDMSNMKKCRQLCGDCDMRFYCGVK